MANQKLRNFLACENIAHWELADYIGINNCTLSVWLRKELEGERKERVERALRTLLEERK